MNCQAGLTVVIFEGGGLHSDVERRMADVRQGVLLDNLDRLAGVPVDGVILGTDRPDLARDAAARGVEVVWTGDGEFHFGRQLAAIVNAHKPDKVLFLGAGSLPLISREDLEAIASEVRRQDNVVVMNNAQSADLLAFSPAGAINRIDPPASDNFLGYLLREAGLERVLLPNNARINFDLDTPTDIAILSLCPGLPSRTAAAVQAFDWPVARIRRAAAAFRRHGGEVLLAGRVGAPVIARLNDQFTCRLRVFSEERGMKALGRDARGEVVSLLGRFIDLVGPDRFFDSLGEVVDAAFIDTRVLFAHWRKRPTDHDRYCSDLGWDDRIDDPDIRLFTRAANRAPIPVVLGGHSAVAGGLWVLADLVKSGVIT